ncbi:xylose isomerase, partial [Pseudomonas oryzihabitans]
MRIAISNIAWDVPDDAMVAEILQQYRVDAIDIAPGKYFADPKAATTQEIQTVRQQWQARGIEITGMQALLFGTTGLNVFGDGDVQQALLAQLEGVCRVAQGLGATRLVFGSPRNRDRSGLSDDQALAQAREFFLRLGDVAAAHGVLICLEPNPPRYGANFI